MLDGREVVEKLEEEKAGGATRDDLLRSAVREIEAAEDYYDWVGIYLLDADETLVLHNYIGEPTEHDRIQVGVGVCGTAVAEGRDINVPDVTRVENYLACSVDTRSEMVVLIRDGGGRGRGNPAPEDGVQGGNGGIHGQIDLDSHTPGAFDDRDRRELRVVADWLAGLF